MRTLLSLEELAITYKELAIMLATSDTRLARHYLEAAHSGAVFVVEQLKEQLGERQPRTWIAQGTLARIKAAMGDIDEAEQMFNSTLPLAARHLGHDHLGVMSHKTHHAKILIQQKRYAEAETLLVEVSKPAKYMIRASTGDHPDRWDALWTLIDCYQKQGQIDRGMATCNELISAVGAIQQEREQTEISSTFWQMALDKRAELTGSKMSISGRTSTSLLSGNLSTDLEPAELDSGLHATSTGTQVIVTGAEDLRMRSSPRTW